MEALIFIIENEALFYSLSSLSLAVLFGFGGYTIYDHYEEKKNLEPPKEEPEESIIIPLNINDLFNGLQKLLDKNIVQFEEYKYIKENLIAQNKPTRIEQSKTAPSLSNNSKKGLVSKFFNNFHVSIETNDYQSSSELSKRSDRQTFSSLNIQNKYNDASNWLFIYDLYKKLNNKDNKFFNIQKVDLSVRYEIFKKTDWKKYFKNSLSSFNEYSRYNIKFLLTPIDFNEYPEEYKNLVNMHETIEELKKTLKNYVNEGGTDQETINLTKSKIKSGEEKASLIISQLEKDSSYSFLEKDDERLNNKTLELFEKVQMADL